MSRSVPRIAEAARRLRLTRFLIAFAGLALALAVAAPTPALAADLLSDPAGWFAELLFGGWARGLLNATVDTCNSISGSGLVLTHFADLFGTNSAIYQLMMSVNNSVIKPIAGSVLALVMLTQLVKVSERVDGSATMPTVREVLSLAVFFTIFSWLITNSADILIAVFDTAGSIIEKMGSLTGTVDFTSGADGLTLTSGSAVPVLLVCLLCFLLSLVAFLVAQFMTYARALQLYVYTMLSPIPLALLGSEYTRQMGIGFLKNYVSVCLAGVIIAFIIACFPMLAGVFVSDINVGAGDSLVTALTAPLKLVVLLLLFTFGIIKSGSWARDILGG